MKRKKSFMGGIQRTQICPHCLSLPFLASKSVLTVKDQRVVAGCGHVQCPQGASCRQDLRVIICSTCFKFLSAVGLGMSTPAGT